MGNHYSIVNFVCRFFCSLSNDWELPSKGHRLQNYWITSYRSYSCCGCRSPGVRPSFTNYLRFIDGHNASTGIGICSMERVSSERGQSRGYPLPEPTYNRAHGQDPPVLRQHYYGCGIISCQRVYLKLFWHWRRCNQCARDDVHTKDAYTSDRPNRYAIARPDIILKPDNSYIDPSI